MGTQRKLTVPGKESKNMDIFMIAALLGSFGLVCLLLAWCNGQMYAEESGEGVL